MGDLISRLPGDGMTLWRPDVRKEALKESTIRPKSHLILTYSPHDTRLGPRVVPLYIVLRYQEFRAIFLVI